MFWALMIVVSLKYVLLIMRADNRGEGGIMALHRARRQGDQGSAAAGAGRMLVIGMLRRLALLRRRRC